MSTYSLTHLSDGALLRDLAALVARDRATTAILLAHIAEVDARKLYLPAAYPSMHAYCVHELRLSEEAAFKRIRVARAARQFPAIFVALAEGRLHLSGLVLLASCLTPGNADELLEAATHKTRSEIELLLAERFPRPELLALVEAIPPTGPADAQAELSPGTVSLSGIEHGAGREVDQLAPAQVGTRSSLAASAPERFRLELTIGRSTRDKLRRAQDLLGHQLPSGDAAEVLDRALDALIEKLEKRKFAATTRPRPSKRPSSNPRHVPAHVRRAVWERDGGQCTFVSEAGRRCAAQKLLEFDHIDEVARGGQATVAGIRLRCRAHNQYAAECTFGAGFMHEKREAGRRAAHARQRESEAHVADDARRRAAHARVQAAAEEVIAPLRVLGFRADEARCAASLCEAIPDAPLEQRVRRALSYFHTRPGTSGQAETSPGTSP